MSFEFLLEFYGEVAGRDMELLTHGDTGRLDVIVDIELTERSSRHSLESIGWPSLKSIQ